MRICVFLDAHRVSGPVSVIAEILDEWPQDDDEFILLGPDSLRLREFLRSRTGRHVRWQTSLCSGEKPIEESPATTFGSSVVRRAGSLLRYPKLFFCILRLRRTFRRMAPDALLVNNGGYPGSDACRAAAIAGRMANIPRVVMAIHSLANPPRFWRIPIEWMIDKWVGRSAELVFVSETARVRCGKVRAIEERGTVIRNGFGGIDEASRTRQEVCKEFGLPENVALIAMVAAYDRQKGHQVLFKAIEKMSPVLPETKLLLFGDGSQDEVARIHELIARHGLKDVVVMCGFRGDVVTYLPTMDLMVLPTLRYESSPMVVIEAMAAGLPVVASNVGGMSELVNDGESGRLVPPGSIEDLSTAIVDALTTPNRLTSWSEAARQRYNRCFTSRRMAERYYRLLTTG